ncbi:MAG: hypothetical protein J6U54_00710 [Clostridiales bacterium]|nr:hypothetical protein [Clostridiales bacterium]
MRYKIETERTELFDVNMMIVMKVVLDKDIDFDLLEKAFRSTCDLSEIFRTKVIIESDGSAYYVDNDHHRNTIEISDLSLNDLICQNEKERFKIENGEFLRVFYTTEGLIFMMHHLGGDGKSLLRFIEGFLTLLSGDNIEPLTFRNTTLDEISKASKVPLFYKFYVDRWNKRWRSNKTVFDYKDMDRAYDHFWRDHKTVTSVSHYHKDELDRLLSEAKRSGVSLTSYLIAKWAKDTAGKISIGLAIDAGDKSHSMGNQVTGIAVRYKYSHNRSLEYNARKIHSMIRKQLSDRFSYFRPLLIVGMMDPSLIDTLCLESAGVYKDNITNGYLEQMGYGSKSRDISVSNLMRIDIRTDYGNFRIEDMVFIPPVVSYVKDVVGILTINDTLVISRHSSVNEL